MAALSGGDSMADRYRRGNEGTYPPITKRTRIGIKQLRINNIRTVYLVSTKRMHTGLGWFTFSPVGVSLPVVLSIENTTIESVS